jgi:hypothetical protein
MDTEKLEKILLPRLEQYMSMEYHLLPNVLGYEIRQQVGRVRHMIFKIYSNDHNPPHFHVISVDRTVNAKFTLSDCELLSGEISAQDKKRVEAFFSFAKELMIKVWDKRNN